MITFLAQAASVSIDAPIETQLEYFMNGAFTMLGFYVTILAIRIFRRLGSDRMDLS